MLRLIDFLIASVAIIFLMPVLIILYLTGFFSTRSPVFIQQRLGKHQAPFQLVKFRTMKLDTVQVGTHLVDSNCITRFGKFLRKTKLDELPQLVNVIKGEMSLVGPRPGLPSQLALLQARQQRGVFSVKPGITGLAQIHQVDMSTPRKLSRYDALMIKKLSIRLYFYLIFATVVGKGQGDKTHTESKPATKKPIVL